MAEIRLRRVEQVQTKIRNVPIAVTPDGFWCCPSPVVFPKTTKSQNPPPSKPKPSTAPQPTSAQKQQQALENEIKPVTSSSRTNVVTDEQRSHGSDTLVHNSSSTKEEVPRPKRENVPNKKVTIEFGEPGTSDLKLILLKKQGVSVKLSVHRSILVKNSSFFAKKIEEHQPVFPVLEIDDCEDVEMYVETIGLMYCKDLRQRLIKQNISRVLCILKVAEQLGFSMCIGMCLDYLEAVPWVGEDEETRVVSSVMHLKGKCNRVKPVLQRVRSDTCLQTQDTLSHICQLVLTSHDEKGRREMKSIVLKLLRESNTLSPDLCNEPIYSCCRSSLESLLHLFRQAAEPEFGDKPTDAREQLTKSMSLEADNLLWLLDILAQRQGADEYATFWADQHELASLHTKLPIACRHHVSLITARLYVGIGKGEILPCKETRHMLLQTWLQPLMNDYRWLQNSCRSFDRNVVEEGIGRTILTLPLEEQQSILLSWLASFLKTGDSCPNLRRAFEIWWRRTFVRPYIDPAAPQLPDMFSEGGRVIKILENDL